MSKAVTKAAVTRGSRADFEYHMNGLRLSIGRTDALADALRRYFDERDDDEVAEQRVSHLIDLTAEAAERATKELDLACAAVGWEVADERS